MLEWAGQMGLPVHVLLTKADKLKRGPASAALLKVKKALREMEGDFSAQLFSSLKRTGIEEAHRVLDHWLARDH
jgi:GTP-binding protein